MDQSKLPISFNSVHFNEMPEIEARVQPTAGLDDDTMFIAFKTPKMEMTLWFEIRDNDEDKPFSDSAHFGVEFSRLIQKAMSKAIYEHTTPKEVVEC